MVGVLLGSGNSTFKPRMIRNWTGQLFHALQNCLGHKYNGGSLEMSSTRSMKETLCPTKKRGHVIVNYWFSNGFGILTFFEEPPRLLIFQQCEAGVEET